MNIKKHWTKTDLTTLYAFYNNKVQHIDCIIWQNQIDPQQTIEIIDALVITFENTKQLIIATDSSGTGLYSCTSIDEHITGLQSPDPRIRLFKARADKTQLWQSVINKSLLSIGLSKDPDDINLYLSDGIILNFENESRELRMHPLDGILLDYYEA